VLAIRAAAAIARIEFFMTSSTLYFRGERRAEYRPVSLLPASRRGNRRKFGLFMEDLSGLLS
jgi:hypothetical protein